MKVDVGLIDVDHITGITIANLDSVVHIRHPTLNDALQIACILSHMCHTASNNALILDVAPNATPGVS
jgi:hypothetical protein